MSVRERRRERRSQPEAAQHDPPLFLNAKSPIVITHATVSPVGHLKEKTAMNAPKQGPVILNERPDDRIDQMLADSTYGPAYLVSVDVSRKGGAGNLTPKLRSGIQCPLVQVKNVAQVLCELVTGGGQLKVDVFHSMDSTGNKTRLLQPWWEGFTDPPRIGKPYEDLTIAWDDSGGDGAGAWMPVPRSGTNQRNQDQAQYGAAPNGFGPVIAGPRVAQAPDFPTPVRGLGGMLLPPPPNLLPASFRSYSAEQQWQILAGQHERTWGVKPNLEPVDIMEQWKREKTHELGDTRADHARLQERHDSLKENSRREVDLANQRMAKLEREMAEQKAAHERELERARQQAKDDKIAAEMAALKEKIAEKRSEPATSAKGIDPGIATIVTTAITQFAAMQTAAAERQQNMMLALMKPAAPPPPQPGALEQLLPLLTVVIPAVTPIVTQMLANKDPSKLEELESERAMRQLQLGQMLMEQIKSMHPPEEPPPLWYPPLVRVIEGMMGTLQTAALAAGAKNLPALPGGQQPAQQQAPAQQAPSKRVIVEAQVTQAERNETIEAAEHAEREQEARADEQPIEAQPPNLEMQIDELAKIDPNAASVTRLAMRTIGARKIDPRLLTPEWTSIVFAIHHRPDLPEEQQQRRFESLVESIVSHLEHCRDFAMLPEPFAKAFEDPESFRDLWKMMPISMMDREYADAMFDALCEEIAERERERLEPVDAEHADVGGDDEDDEEEETPATAGGNR